MLFSSLFARLPALKADIGLGEGEVGLALLCGSAGLILSQPIAGALTTRFGSRPVSAAGIALYGAFTVLPPLADALGPLALAFFAVGAGSGLLDVAMNAQGALAEERHPRAIFSSFHAAFSFGAMGGAALAGAVAALDVSPAAHLAGLGVAAVAVGLPATRWMLPPSADSTGDGRLFARPTGPLLVLGAVAFCAAVSEGAVADWSAILLAEWRDASEATAAIGLTAFSATMGFGRLAADPLRERLGPRRLMRAGATAVLIGLVPVLLPLGVPAAVAGFAVAGAGLASLFPLALLLGSRAPGQSAAAGIAAVSTAGYAGFLAGPATIGFLAEGVSLPAGLAILLPLALAVAALAPRACNVNDAIAR
jgi:MFS family permease